MKIKDILKAGAGLVGTMYPPLGAAIGLVNQFLPEGEKLPETATGTQVEDKVASLPPSIQGTIMEKQVELEIAREEGWTERYKAMCGADGQETRAAIVRSVTRVLCFEILAFTVYLFWYPEAMNSQELWIIFGTLTGVPSTVLLNYFGNLRREQTNRQVSISGKTPAGAIAGLISAFKGK